MKRAYRIFCMALTIVPIVCVIYFIYLSLQLLDAKILIQLPPAFVKILYLGLFLYPIPVVFLVLHVVGQMTARLSYGSEGMEFHNLFRTFRAGWDEIRHAFVLNHHLHVASERGSFGFSLMMFQGDVDALRAYISADRWLDPAAARHRRRKRTLPILLAGMFVLVLLLYFSQRYLSDMLGAFFR